MSTLCTSILCTSILCTSFVAAQESMQIAESEVTPFEISERVAVDFPVQAEVIADEPLEIQIPSESTTYYKVWPFTDSAIGSPNSSDQNPVFFGGWIAQGITGNPSQPSNGLNRPVLFNDQANDYLLNQVYFIAEKSAGKDGLGIGGRIDVMYGSDSQFLTVPGLERHHDHSRKWNAEDARNGFAIPQAYLEFAYPFDAGISLKIGHFRSPAGYETFASPGNFFYSHSYSYTYATPFTQTGAMLSYSPNEDASIFAAYTNGWDVWNSREDLWGILTGFTVRAENNEESLSVVFATGEDVGNARFDGRFVSGKRNALHLVYEQQWTPKLRYVFAPVLGTQQNALGVVDIPSVSLSLTDGHWYGIAQYLTYQNNDWLSSGIRFEWFRDEDHTRLGIPLEYQPGGPVLHGGNYFALTTGVNARLADRLMLRPEFRWDWSDLRGNANVPLGDSSVRAFGDRTDGKQITFGFDLLWAF